MRERNFPTSVAIAGLLLCQFPFPVSGSRAPELTQQSHEAVPAHTKAQPQTDPVELHFRAAESSQLANDLSTAEAEYQRVISLASQKLAASGNRSHGEGSLPAAPSGALREMLANAYHNLGVIYAQGNRYSEAAELFAKAARLGVPIADLDRNWATASFRASDYKTAIPALRRHLHAHIQDTSARQMLAVCYFMTDDFSRAAAVFRALLPTLPDDPSLLYAAGISLAKSGDSKTAGGLFQRMVTQNPDSPEAHLFLGQAHAAQKEDSEALKEFSRAIDLNPKLPQAHYSAGRIYLQAGDLKEAESEFRAELAVNPSDAPTEYRLGHILLEQYKEIDEAISFLSDAVRQRPQDADAGYELGKAFLQKGDAAAASEQIEKAIRLRPEPHMYYQLSLAYRRQDKVKEADAALQKYQDLLRKKFPKGNPTGAGNPR
jgi:tetratricopeptide (TPR) repeat protein